MNTNLLKIVEKLGYIVEFHDPSIRIYDRFHNELPKELITGAHNGVSYTGEINQEIYLDNDGFIQIKVDDDMTIVGYNLYNELDEDGITIIYGPTNFYSLMAHFDIMRNNRDNGNCIFMTTYENTIFAEEDDYHVGNLDIIENENGATISHFSNDIRTIGIDDCTKETYINIIVNYISNIENELIRKDIEKGFDVIYPALEAMIEDAIKNRKNKSHQYRILFGISTISHMLCLA